MLEADFIAVGYQKDSQDNRDLNKEMLEEMLI